jgi:hypothetical protein
MGTQSKNEEQEMTYLGTYLPLVLKLPDIEYILYGWGYLRQRQIRKISLMHQENIMGNSFEWEWLSQLSPMGAQNKGNHEAFSIKKES